MSPATPASIASNGAGDAMTMRRWLLENGFTITVVIFFLAVFALYLNVWAVLKVLLGLSFVIFIHELGHFLVAKWCDVHVTHFSIGFGPKIPGLWRQWGETTYQVCLFPLGGYVQMIGQVDGDESADGSEDDPRSYRNKSVGQRMAIISAGVVMNAILAFICFIVVYRGPGKDRLAAVVAQVDSGAPAFVAGLRSGMLIEQIGDIENPYFDDLKVTVAGSNYGEKLKIVASLPNQKEKLDIYIEPRKNKDDANPIIGINPASQLSFFSNRELQGAFKNPTLPGSVAAKATPAFDFGDEIVGTTDPDDPSKVKPLPADPRKPDQRDYFEFARRMQRLADKEVTIQVQRGEGKTVDVKVPPAFRSTLGARMEMGPIVVVRTDSPAALHGVRIPDPSKPGRIGDLILKAEVKEPDGSTTVFEKKTLDPERFPRDLKAWASRLRAANKLDGAEVKLTMRRHREGPGEQFESVELKLPWKNEYEFDRVNPSLLSSPLAIPELGLGYLVKTTVAEPMGANSPLSVGDVIKNYKVVTVGPDGKERPSSWIIDDSVSWWGRITGQTPEFIGADEWATFGHNLFNRTDEVKKVILKIERDKKIEEVEITPTRDMTWAMQDRGWLLLPDTRIQRAYTTLEAIQMGFKDTHRSMLIILQNLRQMIVGRISVQKSLGGPISIARIAYQFAGYDVWEFIFFMGLISVQLAVINFLPIPVLDGGHMVFLIYEKLRGKPASDGVRAGATYAGLAFILCLMLFVFWLDISRFFKV